MPAFLTVILSAAALPVEPPHSQVPLRFYNRPGATEAMKAAEIAQCRTIVTGPGGTVEPRELTPPTAPLGLPRDVAGPDSSVETCMVMRGWNIYLLAPRERAALARLSPKARARVLRTLTGARHPSRGRLVRDGRALQLRDPAAR